MRNVLLIDCEQRPVRTTSHYYSASMTEPLGLLYLEAFLANSGVDVTVLRHPLDQRSLDLIRKADIVGISGLTYTWHVMLETARTVRSLNPNATIAAGREHATCTPEMVLSHIEFDIVIAGEGEKGMALDRGEPGKEGHSQEREQGHCALSVRR